MPLSTKRDYYSNSINREQMDSLQKFCQRYRAQARTGRPVRRAEPISYNPHWYKDDYKDYFINTFEVETIDLNITEEDFRQLLKDLAEMDSEDYNEYVRLRKHLGEHFVLELYELKGREERERRARTNNPGVQKAWENYQLMLKLAGG